MREILFRAKRIDNGEWVEGYYQKRYDEIGRERHYIFWCESHIVWEYAEVDANTICLFTGLLDKNGNKIWENDIVICKKEINGNFIDEHIEMGFVEMKHGAYGLHRKQGYYRPFKDWLEGYEYEIIGNVFDNKELLEE